MELIIHSEDSAVPDFLIYINGFPMKVRWKTLSAFEIKVLSGLPLDNQLFLVTAAADKDRPVGNMEALGLSEGMEFYDLTPEQLPLGWHLWDGRPSSARRAGPDRAEGPSGEENVM